jgi:hypothetical protein
VARAHEPAKAVEEVEARETLMRQQFERDAEKWEQAVSADEVLAKLEAKLRPTR